MIGRASSRFRRRARQRQAPSSTSGKPAAHRGVPRPSRCAARGRRRCASAAKTGSERGARGWAERRSTPLGVACACPGRRTPTASGGAGAATSPPVEPRECAAGATGVSAGRETTGSVARTSAGAVSDVRTSVAGASGVPVFGAAASATAGSGADTASTWAAAGATLGSASGSGRGSGRGAGVPTTGRAGRNVSGST